MQPLLYTQRLFKKHSTGQIGDYLITVVGNDDGSATINRQSTKVLGGKPNISKTIVKMGKNIGKANETTPCEQAVAEAKSKVSKQLDKGYVKHMPNADAEVTNALGTVQPMLAKPADKVKNWSLPAYVQPKFDGHRLLATIIDDEVVLYSRTGKPVDIQHIKNELTDLFMTGKWDGTTLDGEIYIHGLPLQQISSLVKKPKQGSNNLVYHLYDIVTDEPYGERLVRLQQITASTSAVVLTDTTFVSSTDQLDQLHAKHLSQGYEGTMVRLPHFSYERGKRSSGLLKRKDFQDAEFKIIGFELGKPDIKGTDTFQRPVFKLTTADGECFNCTAPGTMVERHQFYLDGLEKLVGRLLTVKFFNYTDRGAPYLPVALRLRVDL
ncbi:MAG: hypothetical protein GJ680_18085 [Alteromonadaceae bacterium]|nr:hypothetical protein [Alteromonadaceae bacterium]